MATMDPRFSPKVYPRQDTAYLVKKSLNFDLMRTKIYVERGRNATVVLMEWVAFAITGVLTGLTAAIMTYIEEHLTDFRKETTNDIIDSNPDNLVVGWLFFTGFSACLVIVSSCMTVFWGPGANGSGIAELIAYLNGVNYPNVFGFETFVTKAIGVVLAVVGGLCVGKEGPLAHIGANVGCVVLYLPLPKFEYFRNDTYKRYLIAGGCSAGVSAAFGAPVGGALFAFEISKPNTFWKFSVVWKVFFCCAISVLTLATCNDLMKGQSLNEVSSAVLKFGTLSISPPTYEVIPGAFIVGSICGIFGGLFVLVNSNMGLIRKKIITKSWMKVTEAVLFSMLTTSIFYWLPAAYLNCYRMTSLSESNQELAVTYSCPANQYSPLASMFQNTEGSAIRTLISSYESTEGINSATPDLLIFFSAWYIMTITTYGVWVPAGLFLPGIIIGCTIGALYSNFQMWILGNSLQDTVGSNFTAETPVLVGACAMLSAYCRLTYSLVLIMLETSGSINIFIPMMIGAMMARAVGNLLTNSLYDRALRMKQIPFLRGTPPFETRSMLACEIMASEPVCMSTISSMKEVKIALETKHQAFPVNNTAGCLVGLVPRTVIITLAERKAFYDKERTDRNLLSDGVISDRNVPSSGSIQHNDEDDNRQDLLTSQRAANMGKDGPFSSEYDERNGFPKTPGDQAVPWQEFTTDVVSSEADGKHVLEQIVDDCYEEWIDLRPYMIEQPINVSINTKLYAVLESFRLNHLRHLMVVNPADGKIAGIITRKDLFKYMSL